MGLYAAAADNEDCGLVEAVIPEWRPSEPEGEVRPPEITKLNYEIGFKGNGEKILRL